jgi:hypothetical protein
LVSDIPAGDEKIAIFLQCMRKILLNFLSVCCVTNNDDIVHGLEDDGEDEGDDGGQVHHVHPVPHELHLHRAETERRIHAEENLGTDPIIIFHEFLFPLER